MPGKIVGTICARLGGAILLASIVLNFSNVVARYLFSYPIYWADEIVTFLMIWMVMLGAIYATMKNSHLSIDLIFHIRAVNTAVLHVLVSTLGLATCVIVAYSSIDITYMKYAFGQREIASDIPGWIPHLAIFVGFIGSAYFILLILIRTIRNAFIESERNAE